jgi:hypothetical protein
VGGRLNGLQFWLASLCVNSDSSMVSWVGRTQC